MSSITTAIPTNPIEKWCIAAVEFYGGDRYECANETLGYQKADFQTFCCNGDILDGVKDIWRPHAGNNDSSVRLSDMICCGLDGAQAGGIHPLPTAYTTCSEGSPTPLASLAGTNTDNAAPYLVTYTGASYGDNTVGDYVPTATPTCFWAYTVGAETEEITLPAPDIKTLPPATTDEFGFPIESTTTSESSVRTTSTSTAQSGGITSSSTATGAGVSSQGSSETSSAAAASTSVPSSAALVRTGGGRGRIGLCLGFLVAVNLLWS